MSIVIDGIAGLRQHVGSALGTSEWMTVDQNAVSTFADVTRDHNWLHVDPERAVAAGFGGTIAHGYLTLSLIGGLIQKVFEVRDVGTVLNYGLDRVRFIAPVPTGSRIRLNVVLDRVVERDDDATDGHFRCEIEVDGGSRPACVAEILFRYFPPAV